MFDMNNYLQRRWTTKSGQYSWDKMLINNDQAVFVVSKTGEHAKCAAVMSEQTGDNAGIMLICQIIGKKVTRNGALVHEDDFFAEVLEKAGDTHQITVVETGNTDPDAGTYEISF